MLWLDIFHECSLQISTIPKDQLLNVKGLSPLDRKLSLWIFPWPNLLPSAQRKEEQGTDARGQLQKVWAGNEEGKALGGPRLGWAGALLPFNHSPVTCPRREAEAACPHSRTLGKGLGVPWGRVGAWERPHSPMPNCRIALLENFGVS